MQKERDLELQEKLDEQRRVLEGEHEAALQGKDSDAALGGRGRALPPVPSPGDTRWPLPPTSGPQHLAT